MRSKNKHPLPALQQMELIAGPILLGSSQRSDSWETVYAQGYTRNFGKGGHSAHHAHAAPNPNIVTNQHTSQYPRTPPPPMHPGNHPIPIKIYPPLPLPRPFRHYMRNLVPVAQKPKCDSLGVQMLQVKCPRQVILKRTLWLSRHTPSKHLHICFVARAE